MPKARNGDRRRKPRGDAGQGEAADLHEPNADAGKDRRFLVAADRVDAASERRAVQKEHRHRNEDDEHDDGNIDGPAMRSRPSH